MLLRFEVENYKNFKDKIVVDFTKVGGYQFNTDCLSNNLLGKMIIYGRNAVGKTNLGEAIMDIHETLFGTIFSNYDIIINADSLVDYATFFYEFKFKDKQVAYKYQKYENRQLGCEELYIDGEKIYSCDRIQKQDDFQNLYKVKAENVDIEQYLSSVSGAAVFDGNMGQRVPFLRYLIINAALPKDSIIRSLGEGIKQMKRVALRTGDEQQYSNNQIGNQIELFEDRKELDRFEKFLGYMGIECNLTLEKLPDGKSQLYYGYRRLVPFYENASSGTKEIFYLYMKLLTDIQKISFLYIDEFDAFYHYEMARNLIQFLKEDYPECQVILTTHNTNLMSNRLLRPDCLFILSSEGKLTALCDATERELREGHNLEKMYISGEFAKYE